MKSTQYGYSEKPSIYTMHPSSGSTKTQSGIGVGTGEVTKKKCGIIRTNTAVSSGTAAENSCGIQK
jgi:hypothetical protein